MPVTTDPKLSAKLSADYAALQNDMRQARCLAADYQKQLSDKTNDFAALKRTLQHAFGDLHKLQADIFSLREERHRLANQAMRAIALEQKVVDMADEIGRLRASQREIIKVEFEDLKPLVVIPSVAEPRPMRRGRRSA